MRMDWNDANGLRSLFHMLRLDFDLETMVALLAETFNVTERFVCDRLVDLDLM